MALLTTFSVYSLTRFTSTLWSRSRSKATQTSASNQTTHSKANQPFIQRQPSLVELQNELGRQNQLLLQYQRIAQQHPEDQAVQTSLEELQASTVRLKKQIATREQPGKNRALLNHYVSRLIDLTSELARALHKERDTTVIEKQIDECKAAIRELPGGVNYLKYDFAQIEIRCLNLYKPRPVRVEQVTAKLKKAEHGCKENIPERLKRNITTSNSIRSGLRALFLGSGERTKKSIIKRTTTNQQETARLRTVRVEALATHCAMR